jgi:uncharacterized repeat protein (TIGR02543 family)
MKYHPLSMPNVFRFLMALVLAFGMAGLSPHRAAGVDCTVSTDADFGTGSLSDKISTTSCSTIDFAGDYIISQAYTALPDLSRTLTIDGTGHTITLDGGGGSSYWSVFHVTSNGIVTLKNLTIQNGRAADGAGIYNDNGTLTLTGITLQNNSAQNNTDTARGGGIFNIGGSVTVTRSKFINNAADLYGGGIYNSGTLTVTDSILQGNSTVGATGKTGEGGGIFNDYGTLTITHDTIYNSAADMGGGLFIYANPTTPASITNSTFDSNSAFSGAGIYIKWGDTIVTNSTFKGNQSSGWGAGIFAEGNILTVTNSTFTGNSANGGGGIYGATDLNLKNSTFSANYSFPTYHSQGGADILNIGSLKFTNTILANPLRGDDCVNQSVDGASIVTNVKNLVTGGACVDADDPGITIPVDFSGNPLLATLQDNSGLTQTMALLPGSPAIDAGDESTCADTTTVNHLDQRGVTRPAGKCDLGAFESQGFSLAKAGASGDNQSTYVNNAFALPLGLTITSSHSEPVNGGKVTFTGPSSGASTNPVTVTATISGGAVSQSVTANGTAGGPYTVSADAKGSTGAATFSLTNLPAHTVTFHGNGADGGSMPQQAASTSTPLTLNAFTRTGHTFAGWNTQTGGGGSSYTDGQNYDFSADLDLHAQWTLNTYTVSYNGNSSTSGTAPGNQTKTYGVDLTLATNSGNLAKTGYTFSGWNTLSTGTGTHYDVGGTYTTDAAVILYAEWMLNTYTVSYDGNGNTGGTAPDNQTKTYGVDLTLATNSGNLVRTGYTFAGWNTLVNGTGTHYAAGGTYTANAAVNLHAQWTRNSYTVYFNSQGGSPTPANQIVAYGSLVTNPGDPFRAGFFCTGWYSAPTGGYQWDFNHYGMGASDMTLYAQWTVSTYGVFYIGNGSTGGTVPGNQTKTYGVDLTLATNSGNLVKTGYTFTGWNTLANGTGTHYAAGGTYTANAEVTLYAEWTVNTYTVSFDARDGTPTPDDQTVAYGGHVTDPGAPTRTSYTFNGWFTASTGGSQWNFSTDTMGAATMTLYAQWTAVPPAAFTKTSPAPDADNVATSGTLYWGTSSGATSYELCLSLYVICSYSDVENVTSYNYSGLQNGKRYYWQVRAVNAAGNILADSDATWYFDTVAGSTLPVVTTQAVSSIGTTTATGNGNVTSLGVPNPTQHGVVWSSSLNPTTADSKTTDGPVSATGTFTSSITGLSAGTLYHVRAYATNTAGTAYGEDVSFTTNAPPVVAAFSMPATSTSLDISINPFTATDDVSVTGYQVTQSSVQPAAGGSAWSVSAPSSYHVAGLGHYTFYPWAEDGAGSVSDAYGSPANVFVCSNSITVGSNNDSGAGSLRQTIADICPGGTITFDADHTITLLSALPDLDRDMSIDGGSHHITLDGDGKYRIFHVLYEVSVTLNALTITNGHELRGGGIFIDGTLTLTNSTLSNNSSDSDGAGIYSQGSLSITNSTFSGNVSGGEGGGIYSAYIDATITNSTLSSNSADYLGGDLYGAATLVNTILGPATPDTCRGIFIDGGHNIDAGWNCDFWMDPTTSRSGVDPLLAALGDYGGPTQTMALLPGSPAIDAGDALSCPSKDQRGVVRPQGSVCDIGAFESKGFTMGSLTGTPQSTTVSHDFGTALGLTVTPINTGDPVAGGVIIFTPPSSGASATITGSPATIDSNGAASVTASANGTVGSYAVTASASGADSVDFSLSNYDKPTAVTGTTSPITSGSATLSGTVNANNASTTVTFEYGPDASYGTSVPATPSPVTGMSNTSVSAALSNLTPNTPYHFRVVATNAGGTTNGDDQTFTTLSATFSKLTPANGATGQPANLTLSWNPNPTGATAYYYCYYLAGNGGCDSWKNNGTSTSVTLSGLSPSKTYYWQVKAVVGSTTVYADGSRTAFWAFKTAAFPGAFNKSSPSDGATGQSINPTLKWASSSGATSYSYCYDTVSGCTSWVNNGTATSVVLSGLSLSPNTPYYWQVKADNDKGTTYANGSVSTYWHFTTGNLPGGFGKSSPMDATPGLPSRITIKWGSSSGASSYWYCYDTTDDDACSTWVNNGDSHSKTLSGLIPDTTYYWQVKAVSRVGTTYADGDLTAFWSFTTGSAPGDFNKIFPPNTSTGQSHTLTLSWGASAGATRYEVCYSRSNPCSNWSSVGTATSRTLYSLYGNSTYYWQVRAVNDNGTTYADGSNTDWWFKTK